MTDHEMVLLRAAVEAWREAHPVLAIRVNGRNLATAEGCTALLTDLGAEVPEWPSEERVAELRGERVSRDEYERLTDLPLPEYLALRGAS